MNTRRTPDLDDLNPDQRARLIQFQEVNGRTWKNKLWLLWESGKDAAEFDGHLLRQIRNQFGPEWLNKL